MDWNYFLMNYKSLIFFTDFIIIKPITLNPQRLHFKARENDQNQKEMATRMRV